jgi:hypothetical protein
MHHINAACDEVFNSIKGMGNAPFRAEFLGASEIDVADGCEVDPSQRLERPNVEV